MVDLVLIMDKINYDNYSISINIEINTKYEKFAALYFFDA